MRTLLHSTLLVMLELTVLCGQEQNPAFPPHVFDKTVYLTGSPRVEIASLLDGNTYRLVVESRPEQQRIASLACRIGSTSFVVPRELFADLQRVGVVTHMFKYREGSIAFVITNGDGEGAINCCFSLKLASLSVTRENWTKFGQPSEGSNQKIEAKLSEVKSKPTSMR